MSVSFELSVEVSEQYDFKKEALDKIGQNVWVRNQWPLVYFIQNEKNRLAYVGESTNALNRIKNHLANQTKSGVFNKISIIGSDKFNKSATLDIESYLIQYLSSEGNYQLQNGNFGLVNHSYYQQDLYRNLFTEIWSKLIEKKIVTRSLKEIENSEIFKYSPYKSLNEDQYNSVLEILDGLTTKNSSRIFVSGSAGTGKTILATYLIKLLNSKIDENHLEEFNEDELAEIKYIRNFQAKFPDAKIGLVVAMTSLRESLKAVFRNIPGLTPSMVISPSETFSKTNEPYDLLIVDEAHRLRQYKNIGWRGVFKKNNEKLSLGNNGTELDWIIANSKNQLFFYDSAQSIKPSDIDEIRFSELLSDASTLKLSLHSQMRVQGGVNYIQFVDDLLNANLKQGETFNHKKYDLLVFDSLDDLYKELAKKEEVNGLCRLVAGYSWPWLSNTDKNAIDIEIDGLQFQWNREQKDWINSKNAFKEVGCIHTTQGYDLNYTGIIFGKEINYNNKTGQIEIYPDNYKDKNGKIGIANEADLRNYIINIYKTIMYRGIKGTFIYACNPGLREYLKKHIASFREKNPFRILSKNNVKPFVNSVPLVDISAAAGGFSDLQIHDNFDWIELPTNVSVKQGYFVCKVVGESMNQKIPNGSYCLFKKYEGGSRNGEIVLVENTHWADAEFGSRYTIKEYKSIKEVTDEGWSHQSIILKPLSHDPSFKEIVLKDEDAVTFKPAGIFVKVL